MKMPKALAKAGRQLTRFIKNNEVELLLGAGILTGVATVIVACVQTTKAEEVLDHMQDDLTQIHNATEAAKQGLCDYSQSTRTTDLVGVYARTAFGMIRNYAPAAALGAVSIFCILKAYGIQKRQYAVLMGAYTALDKAYQEYRSRVLKKLGPDADRYFRTGAYEVEIPKLDADGKPTGETEKITVFDDDAGHSMYAKFFDHHSRSWTPDALSNLTFLRSVQLQMQRQLDTEGCVFLNDVYDMLGMPREPYGQIVGWFKDEGEAKQIDFGIMEGWKEAMKDHCDPYDKAILLDFNVDGPVWEKLDWLNLNTRKAITPATRTPDDYTSPSEGWTDTAQGWRHEGAWSLRE